MSVIEHDGLLYQGADWDFGTIQRIHDAVPDACLPPTNEATIASGGGTIGSGSSRLGAPEPQDPKDTVQDAPVVNTGNATRLVRKERPDGPFKVREFIPHDSRPLLGA